MKNHKRSRLGIVGTVGVPAKYGGFETLVHHLVLNLNNTFDITVYNSEIAYPKEEQVSEWQGAKIEYIPLRANGYQSVLYDLWSIIHALPKNDFLLILGVSAGIFFPFIKFFSKKKLIVNIDGLEWRRPKWNWFAKFYLKLCERIVCKYADEIVTDNRILKEYVKIRYNRESALIEYGADHTEKQDFTTEDLREFPFLNKKYAFKVARIEPENNIQMVLESFAKQPDFILALVGNWEASSYGRNLKTNFSKYKNLHLLDPIYDVKNLDVIRSNAYIYVHGHTAGGTNPSLVEAMYLRIPVISFDVIFNRVTTNNQAIYFCNASELSTIIKNIEKYPLIAVAENLKIIADRQYSWKNISHKYTITIDPEFKKTPTMFDTFEIKVDRQVDVEMV